MQWGRKDSLVKRKLVIRSWQDMENSNYLYLDILVSPSDPGQDLIKIVSYGDKILATIRYVRILPQCLLLSSTMTTMLSFLPSLPSQPSAPSLGFALCLLLILAPTPPPLTSTTDPATTSSTTAALSSSLEPPLLQLRASMIYLYIFNTISFKDNRL